MFADERKKIGGHTQNSNISLDYTKSPINYHTNSIIALLDFIWAVSALFKFFSNKQNS